MVLYYESKLDELEGIEGVYFFVKQKKVVIVNLTVSTSFLNISLYIYRNVIHVSVI